ncbi:MAG: DUF5808 domain-containing protein [Alicyclobacillus macrosporangiidus]|uniref:DUF1648 domain-containing protein n=1 Tax=Alicyclobacillus macrosporangiidus TaxID=392015 RepID=UPI0026EA656A|nr:DUF5808 domain-containing protein [Alicyclobacillus macrosporangiidus]MCL6600082.1 DUF5808 domain-containing protein [Alicyclobacillus macrosporangiidus]
MILSAHVVELLVIVLLVVVEALLPAVMPETLPFGVRVPLTHAKHPAVTRAARRYFRRLALLAVILVAMDLAAWRLPGAWAFVAEQAVVLLAAAACYFNYYIAHRQIRQVKEAEDWFAGATQVVAADTRPRRLPSLWWGAPALLVFLAIVAAGVWRYPDLPARFPIHFATDGTPTQWADKSISSVFGILIPGLVLLALCLLVHIASRAGRTDVDPEAPQASLHLQTLQRRRWILATWCSCAFVQVGLGLAALLMWGLLGPATGWPMWVIPLTIVTGAIAPWVIVLAKTARRSGGSVAAAAVPNGPFPGAGAPSARRVVHRDDDRFWKGGVLYFNRDDPALLVPKRFGIGWTLNFAHPGAWLLIIALLLITSLPAIVAFLYGR